MKNNEILQSLIDMCEKVDATVMSFHIINEDGEPCGVIEDKYGRLSSVYFDGEIWK